MILNEGLDEAWVDRLTTSVLDRCTTAPLPAA